ncbi:MAG: cyclase family protein [Ectothiorhodospiraceae bacterium]|nr:cyclase family protein [Ectothiorhodospiraceae bacterium]
MTACVHDHGAYGAQRYGAADRIGAGNLLTAERRLAALSLVRTGALHDLGHVIENGAPRIQPNQTPFVMTLSARADNVIRRRRAAGATNDAGTTLERIEMTTHVGTHIDALGHATVGNRMYNGLDAAEVLDDFGLRELGIENVPPMVTRGVCLDASGLDGGEYLEPGRAITADDLERLRDRARVEIGEGDVVCVNTGWGRWFMRDNDRYVSGEPGIDESGARWLTERGVVAIASDNMAVEVVPNPDHPRLVLPVHQHALAEAGVYLIENIVLDGLVAAGHAEFCFVLLATKYRGATGCPVRPIAMV